MSLNNVKRDSSYVSGAHTIINQGLRTYLLKVYQLMGLGLLVSALTAYLGTTPAFLRLLFTQTASGTVGYSLFGWLVILSPLVLVFMFSSSIRQLNTGKAQAIFWIFSALMGFSLTSLLLIFSTASIFQTFIVTSAAFGALCLYGYTTKRDLSGWGAFLTMGLFGLIIAMLINFFMQSAAFSYFISIVGVGIFTGLTAFDTQRIKMIYSASDSREVMQSKAIAGALTLYLDFINLFVMLLRLTGDRR